MKSKLVIVESPSKAKTIATYLGSEYEVMSSVGHIRDLATTGPGGLGLDIENNFKPNYVTIKGKTKVVSDLKKAAKGKEVLIATDPDREGEAIAWHIADVLGLDINLDNRIVFTEITKGAILEAINNPRKIDRNLVDSQEVRRAIDRIIGFKLSKLLSTKIKSKSAGRVQSVALKLIVDLEKEIKAFIPEEYYEIDAIFNEFKASYIIKGKERIKLEEANKIVETSTNPFIVDSIEVKDSNRKPKPAFTTSQLQQDANIYLGMSSSRTMRIAQQLYEGIEINGELTGLITYMRTDSTRLSEVFIKDANNFIKNEFGNEYLGSYKYVKNDASQDAHEAIRPTLIENTPAKMRDFLDDQQFKLYKRIYERAVSSLMSDAIFERTKVILNANGNLYDLNGVREKFKGFLALYDEQQTKDVILPLINVGDKFNANSVEKIRKETQPKARYNEASLIKEMESLGIGRPSTYAQTMETLKSPTRGYITLDKKRFIPTDQGILTIDRLDEFFSEIINVNYTKQMEENLDEVSLGNIKDLNVLTDFYYKFIPMIDYANINMEKIMPTITDEICPLCGNHLVIRKGPKSEFYGCLSFPKCKFTKSIDNVGENATKSHN